jgi:hypothetical protein
MRALPPRFNERHGCAKIARQDSRRSADAELEGRRNTPPLAAGARRTAVRPASNSRSSNRPLTHSVLTEPAQTDTLSNDCCQPLSTFGRHHTRRILARRARFPATAAHFNRSSAAESWAAPPRGGGGGRPRLLTFVCSQTCRRGRDRRAVKRRSKAQANPQRGQNLLAVPTLGSAENGDPALAGGQEGSRK